MRIKYGRLLKERLQKEEETRKKAVEQLEGARVELMTAQAELAQLKEAFLKFWEDAVMEVSRLQARVKVKERKVVEVPGEIAAAKTVALLEY